MKHSDHMKRYAFFNKKKREQSEQASPSSPNQGRPGGYSPNQGYQNQGGYNQQAPNGYNGSYTQNGSGNGFGNQPAQNRYDADPYITIPMPQDGGPSASYSGQQSWNNASSFDFSYGQSSQSQPSSSFQNQTPSRPQQPESLFDLDEANSDTSLLGVAAGAQPSPAPFGGSMSSSLFDPNEADSDTSLLGSPAGAQAAPSPFAGAPVPSPFNSNEADSDTSLLGSPAASPANPSPFAAAPAPSPFDSNEADSDTSLLGTSAGAPFSSSPFGTPFDSSPFDPNEADSDTSLLGSPLGSSYGNAQAAPAAPNPSPFNGFGPQHSSDSIEQPPTMLSQEAVPASTSQPSPAPAPVFNAPDNSMSQDDLYEERSEPTSLLSGQSAPGAPEPQAAPVPDLKKTPPQIPEIDPFPANESPFCGFNFAGPAPQEANTSPAASDGMNAFGPDNSEATSVVGVEYSSQSESSTATFNFNPTPPAAPADQPASFSSTTAFGMMDEAIENTNIFQTPSAPEPVSDSGEPTNILNMDPDTGVGAMPDPFQNAFGNSSSFDSFPNPQTKPQQSSEPFMNDDADNDTNILSNACPASPFSNFGSAPASGPQPFSSFSAPDPFGSHNSVPDPNEYQTDMISDFPGDVDENATSVISQSSFDRNSASQFQQNMMNQNSSSAFGPAGMDDDATSVISQGSFDRNSASQFQQNMMNQNSSSAFGPAGIDDDATSVISQGSFDRNSASQYQQNMMNQNSSSAFGPAGIDDDATSVISQVNVDDDATSVIGAGFSGDLFGDVPRPPKPPMEEKIKYIKPPMGTLPADVSLVLENQETHQVIVLSQKAVLVGRGDICDWQIIHQTNSNTISRQHGWLYYDKDKRTWVVQDMSKVGTRVNGAPINPAMPCPLMEGNQVQFGLAAPYRISFRR